MPDKNFPSQLLTFRSPQLSVLTCRMVLSLSPVLAVKPWKTRCGLASPTNKLEADPMDFMAPASDMVGGFSAKSWRKTTLDKP